MAPHAPAASHPHAARRRRWLRVLGLLALGLLVLLGWQALAGRRSAAQLQAAREQAPALYAAYCAACHGGHMEGRPPPDKIAAPPLNKPGFAVFFVLLPDAMEDWVREQITDGGPPMPPFRLVLSDPQRAALALYIRRVNMGGLPPP